VADLDHLTVMGYGATLGMWRSHYQSARGGLTINRGATGPYSVTASVLFDNCRIGDGSAKGIWVTGVHE
jgi:hypothetical protein